MQKESIDYCVTVSQIFQIKFYSIHWHYNYLYDCHQKPFLIFLMHCSTDWSNCPT